MSDYIEWVGWLATGTFTLSYLVKTELKLLLLQAVAATIWCTYGVLIAKPPLIVANVIVASSAGFRAFRRWRRAA
jgi:hypothetical protein